MLNGADRCTVCGRPIVHPDDHLHIPLPDGVVDIHRLCVPDWVGYDAAVSALQDLGTTNASARRLLNALEVCREIPPVP